jgi:hypothetical protein
MASYQNLNYRHSASFAVEMIVKYSKSIAKFALAIVKIAEVVPDVAIAEIDATFEAIQ